VAAIEATDAVVGLLANWRAGNAVANPTDQVAKRVAPQGIATQQRHIHKQHEGANTDAKAAVKPKTFPSISGQDDEEHQCEIKKITMNILQD
jgi:hypothetical protein